MLAKAALTPNTRAKPKIKKRRLDQRNMYLLRPMRDIEVADRVTYLADPDLGRLATPNPFYPAEQPEDDVEADVEALLMEPSSPKVIPFPGGVRV